MWMLLYPNISVSDHDDNSKYITRFYWYFWLTGVSLNFGKRNIISNWQLEDANDSSTDKDSTHKQSLQIETLRRNIIWMCGNKLTFFRSTSWKIWLEHRSILLKMMTKIQFHHPIKISVLWSLYHRIWVVLSAEYTRYRQKYAKLVIHK